VPVAPDPGTIEEVRDSVWTRNDPPGQDDRSSARTLAPDPVLTDRVRKGQLPAMVNGPVVVLNLDLGSFVTFCDQLAVRLAQDLSLKLTDPSREAAECRTGRGIGGCIQLVPQPGNTSPSFEMVHLRFELTPTPRLTSAVVGIDRKNIRLVDELNARAAAATCP
jgi:hypothetical protein